MKRGAGSLLETASSRELTTKLLMEPLLRNLVLVFLVAAAVLHVFHRLRLPSIVGLLVAGVLIGPHGFSLLPDREQIERLAEIGILLLMFTIGLDFTRERLFELLHASGMGAAQMLICIFGTMLATVGFVGNWTAAIFLGFLVSHTSSTLMLKLFLDRGELSSPPVRLGLGISIVQDLSVVLMLLAVPMMAGEKLALSAVGIMVLRIVGVLAVALVLARWLIPVWMDHVIRSRSRELFLIFVIVVCLGTAWATLASGLSIGLGAFLAGLAIAGSGYSHHALSELAPFRDLLISLFFISTGMLLDLGALWSVAGLAAAALAGVVVIKFASGFLPVLAWRFPLRTATTVGVAMAQIGEFSFVLGYAGLQAELISQDRYVIFLLVAVGSMVLSPFLVNRSNHVAALLARINWFRKLDHRTSVRDQEDQPPLRDHVIIAGYGLNGRNLATALQTLRLPYAVLEMNPDSVQGARRRGEPVFFGDCSRAEVLRKMHVSTARGLVLAISDLSATRQAVQIARQENPHVHILVRTRYMSEIDLLREIGADEVIAEEFETSLEILTLTLRLFDTPTAAVNRVINHFRGNAYQALRGDLPTTERIELLRSLVPEFDLETYELPATSTAIGTTLREINLRARTGATLLAVRRRQQLVSVPDANFRFEPGDVLVLAGTLSQIADAQQLFAPLPAAEPGDGTPSAASES